MGKLQSLPDRRAAPPYNADVATIEADDPYEPGGRILALASLRDDPLGRLFRRGHIDQAQYAAGRHVQELFEVAELGRVGAVDTTQTPVDGGAVAVSTISDRVCWAMAELRKLRTEIGPRRFFLLRDVLAERMFVYDAGAKRGYTTERQLKVFAEQFRQALELAACALGYATDLTAYGK